MLKDYKKDFPIFKNNPWLIFLDNWASTQKPSYVIDWVSEFVSHDYANIHRWVYSLSEKSEELFWNAKKIVAKHLNIKQSEIVFTYNATYAMNILANSLASLLCISRGEFS